MWVIHRSEHQETGGSFLNAGCKGGWSKGKEQLRRQTSLSPIMAVPGPLRFSTSAWHRSTPLLPQSQENLSEELLITGAAPTHTWPSPRRGTPAEGPGP